MVEIICVVLVELQGKREKRMKRKVQHEKNNILPTVVFEHTTIKLEGSGPFLWAEWLEGTLLKGNAYLCYIILFQDAVDHAERVLSCKVIKHLYKFAVFNQTKKFVGCQQNTINNRTRSAWSTNYVP